MPSVNLKTFSVSQLLALRVDIDKTLQSRRSELQAQLAEIGRGENGGGPSAPRGRKTKGSKVAAKYRHPTTGETWSGRGGVAGWLQNELKSGKKREDFLIDGQGTGRPKAKKTGRRGRPRKVKSAEE